MFLPDRPAFRLGQHAGEGAGLAKPTRHGGVAHEEVGDFPGAQAFQNLPPFHKGRAKFSTITSRPSAQVIAGDRKDTPVAAQSQGYHPVLGRIHAVNDQV
jgi:hypothetical protein